MNAADDIEAAAVTAVADADTGASAAEWLLLIKRHLPTSVVDDLLDNTSDVTVALGVVVDTELGGGLVVLGVSGEDTTALSLSSNDPTHCCLL